MMGHGGGWGILLDGGMLSMTTSRSRHSDDSPVLDTKRDWELIVIDIISPSEIDDIITEAKSLMFNDAERDLKYSILKYPTFTVLDVSLCKREWWVYDESAGGDAEKHLSTTVDQIVFCSLLIALLKDHLIDLGEHILQTSDVTEDSP